MNFYAFNIGDYTAATAHLSWNEDMAYRRMLDAYYSREAPLPLDRRQLYRLVRASEQAMREAVDTVLEEFFDERADGWHNDRADEEIAKTAIKKEKARASAMLSVAARQRSTDAQRTLSDRSTDADTKPANADETPNGRLAPNPNPNPNKERGREVDARAQAINHELFKRLEHTLRQIPELEGHPVAINTMIAPIFRLVVDHHLDIDTQIIPSIRAQAQNARRPIKAWAYFSERIIADNTAVEIIPPAKGYTNGTASRSRRPSPAQEMRDAIADVKDHIAKRHPDS